MIDLTPLDVRNKRGDFKRLMRGYDTTEVDAFLELVAERLEALVRENLQLRERTQTLQQQVSSQLGREQAVQDALVTAQELRADIKEQAQREADHALREAQIEGRRLIAEAEAEARMLLRDAERRLDVAKDTLVDFERRRTRFLKEFRLLLERELDVVEVEEAREPLESRAIDIDLGRPPAAAPRGAPPAASPDAAPDPAEVESAPTGAEASLSAPEGPSGADTVATGQSASDDTDEEAAEEDPTVRAEGSGPAARAPEPQVDDLAVSFEAEAVAEASSQVVEVTRAAADELTAVPRLEEVLAEAGAELTQTAPEELKGAPEGEEIAPPRAPVQPEEMYLLYLEPKKRDG